MAQVQLNAVCKSYVLKTPIISDANITINDGEFMVLVGPSGSGKSTILRMIAGLETITSGEILIDGKIVTRLHPKDRDIAMVFQDYALYPHMSVYDNMAFSLKSKKYSKAIVKKRVLEAAEILDLTQLLTRKPKSLSGGQRQRVAVGRAIVRQPKVFLFDEPLSNLDAKLRTQMRLELKRLHSYLKATIIYVTHDQTEAMTLGNKITVLDHGIVQQIDTPLNIYNNPANKFVASFLGSPPINFFDSTIVFKNNNLYISNNTWEMVVPEKFKSIFSNLSSPIKIIVGVRPEDIFEFDDSSETQSDIHFNATVDVVETLGAEVVCSLQSEAGPIQMRISDKKHVMSYSGKVNKTKKLTFDMEQMLMFDPHTGNNLLLKPSS